MNMTQQHRNDVLVVDGWHIVRNEYLAMAGTGIDVGNNVYFRLYHACEKGMTKTVRSAGNRGGSGGVLVCKTCTKQAPDVVQGYMNLIEWSMSDE